MGMDVYGKAPVNKQGEYFRNSCWSWRPLWDYVCAVGNLSDEVRKSGHYNDGAGLGAKESLALSKLLQAEIESGRCAQYAAAYEKSMAAVEDEVCTICAGAGRRLPPPARGAGDMPCNGCASKGTRRPSSTYYTFSVENVAEFSEFLAECGGFAIN